MLVQEFEKHIQKMLLYYEIFDHPLTAYELYTLFPRNSLTQTEFNQLLDCLVRQNTLQCADGYYQLKNNAKDLPSLRRSKQNLAQKRLLIARFMSYIIRTFPFVRGIFVSGDLSKGVASSSSDIDYVIITVPKRLWICRTLLILFKKIFLFNKRKYFCLNYFASEDNLELDEKNYYTATEIAYLKPLYNENLFLQYMNANHWIRQYFPNYFVSCFTHIRGKRSLNFLQKIFESVFIGAWVDQLDSKLMRLMKELWEKRYPHYDAATREKIFRSTNNESRAFIGNFSEKVLSLYSEKLKANNLS